MSTERSALLDRRASSQKEYNTAATLTIPLPSPYKDQELLVSPSSATPSRHFKWFNKRTGSYDEDRQGLVKESTGVRVWSESYSSIGKRASQSIFDSSLDTIS